MRPVLPDKVPHTFDVVDDHVVHLVLHHFGQAHAVRYGRQLDGVPEAREPQEHVTIITVHVGGVDAHVLGDGVRLPTPAERPPGPVQHLERVIPEVRLQQLLQVVAKLQVEVAVEDGLLGASRGVVRDRDDVGEDVHGGLAEDPVLVALVPRHHLHADAEIAVPREDVDGVAHPELRLVVGAAGVRRGGCGVVAVRHECSDHQHEQGSPATPHPRRDWHLHTRHGRATLVWGHSQVARASPRSSVFWVPAYC